MFLPAGTAVVSVVKKTAAIKLARIIVSVLWLSSEKNVSVKWMDGGHLKHVIGWETPL